MRFITLHLLFLVSLLSLFIFGCSQSTIFKGDLENHSNISEQVQNYTNISYNSTSYKQNASFQNKSTTSQNISDLIINPISNCSNQTLPIVYYYYSSRCSACKEIRPLIDYAKNDYSAYACFVENDVLTKEGIAAYNKFAEERKLNATSRYVPVIEVGNKTLTGLQQINYTSLYNALSAYTNVSVLDENNPH